METEQRLNRSVWRWGAVTLALVVTVVLMAVVGLPGVPEVPPVPRLF
jgi:hypothetical protein